MTGTFTAIDGTQYTVTVGTAAGTLTLAADPVHISWSRAENIYDALRSIEATIRILTSSDISSIYADSPVGTIVQIKKSDTVIFDGFLTPQTWDAPDRGINDEVEIIAVDKISASKKIPYVMRSTYPSFYTAYDFISYFASNIISCSFNSSLSNNPSIDECAFLPEDRTEGVHGDNRTMWSDVIEAIGRLLGITFYMDGNELKFVEIDSVVSSGSITIVGNDLRKSIEPARSFVSVSYNTETISLVPKIGDDSHEDTLLASTHTEGTSTDSGNHTDSDYFNDKNFEYNGSGSTKGCFAVVTKIDQFVSRSNISEPNETYCIVGPAKIKLESLRVCSADTKFKIKISAWGRNDMTTNSNGYKILTVWSKKRNIDMKDMNFTWICGGSTGNLIPSNFTDPTKDYGFSSLTLQSPYSTYPQFGNGPFLLYIPDNVVVSDISVELGSHICAGLEPKIEGNRKYSIHDGYNEGISIDCKLRPTTYVMSRFDVFTTVDKYPYINTTQYGSPRKIYSRTIELIEGLNPTSCVTYNGGKYIVDSADIDIRMCSADVKLLEKI